MSDPPSPSPSPNNNNDSSWDEQAEVDVANEEASRMEENGAAPEEEIEVQRAMEGYAREFRRNANTNYGQNTASMSPLPQRLSQFNWAPPPQNAFSLFWREKRPEIMEKYEYGSNPLDVNRELAKLWKWLPEQKRGFWLEMFKALKEKYLKTHPDYRFRSPSTRNPRPVIPHQQNNQNRQRTPFERFYEAITNLADFNQGQFPPEDIDQDIDARWYMMTRAERATFAENYIAPRPNRQNREPRIPHFNGNQRLVAVSPTRPNAFVLEMNPPNADPQRTQRAQRAQDQRYQPERPRPAREVPRVLLPGRRQPQPQTAQNAEAPASPKRCELEDPYDLAELFQQEDALVDIDLYAGPAPIASRDGSESPERNRDPYSRLLGIATNHSGLYPDSRPAPGRLRLHNDPEDFVEYELPNGNLPQTRQRRRTPNILRRGRSERPEQLSSPEGSQNENSAAREVPQRMEPLIVQIIDQRHPDRRNEHRSPRPQERPRGRSNGSRGSRRPQVHHRQQNPRGHQQRNVAQIPALMDLDLSPPASPSNWHQSGGQRSDTRWSGEHQSRRPLMDLNLSPPASLSNRLQSGEHQSRRPRVPSFMDFDLSPLESLSNRPQSGGQRSRRSPPMDLDLSPPASVSNRHQSGEHQSRRPRVPSFMDFDLSPPASLSTRYESGEQFFDARWSGEHQFRRPMDLDLSPPRQSPPRAPLFSRPSVEASSPVRGSPNPPQHPENTSGSGGPRRQLAPVSNTQQHPVARRDLGPDPPEDPVERMLWDVEQRLMEQRYGTPSKFSPPRDQRVLGGTPQLSTPRSGPAASPFDWTPGSGPLSVSFHRSPMVNLDDEEFRPPSSAPNVASRVSEEVEDQEGLDIPDDGQYLEIDDQILEVEEVHPDEMAMYLGPILSGDGSDFDEIDFDIQGLQAQDTQENHQIQEHNEPQEPQQIEQGPALQELQGAQEPQLRPHIMEEMAEMYLNPIDNDPFSDLDALFSTFEPLDPDHPIFQILKQG